MPDIHIERKHALGIAAAREVARQWLQKVERDYALECRYDEGEACDVAAFTRPGIDGSVEVTGDSFVLQATLGFLFANFREQIEQRLQQNLDALLGASEPPDDAYNDRDWL
ncbi:MAG: polyhydroxyalkanoic acid synthase [Variovorax sp.]|nr:MAG: polyhydroxyalkanoic acid synthase [Variovorax sp.]